MLRKPGKEMPALYGGIIIALISNIPGLNLLNCLCCAGVMLGGVLAVMFYKNDFTPETPPFSSGDCLTVGGLAGLVGAVIGTMLWAIIQALFGNVMAGYLLRTLQELNLPNLPPSLMDDLQKNLQTPLSFIMVAIQLLINLVIDIIFGSLGGLIGFNIFKPKQLYMPPPNYPQQGPPTV